MKTGTLTTVTKEKSEKKKKIIERKTISYSPYENFYPYFYTYFPSLLKDCQGQEK